MFKIEKYEFGRFSKVRLINSVSGEHISVIPEYGGNVNEIVLNNNGINVSILDGVRDDSELEKNMERFYQNAKLIPFPNRIRDGKYCFEGMLYQFPINEMDRHHRIHGFLYDKKMNILDQSVCGDKASLILGYTYKGDVEGYPFMFDLKITYALSKGNGFKCTTEFKNTDNRKVPVGDGWHPYFKTGRKVDELLLELPTDHMVELDANMIPNGEMITCNGFSTPSKIGAVDFDSTFYLGDRVEKSSTIIYDTETGLEINVWQESSRGKYNYLQIFIPPHRESIAIEPMTCNVNAFNNNDGLIILEPGDAFKASYGVSIN